MIPALVFLGALLLLIQCGFRYVRASPGPPRPLLPSLALAHLCGSAALGGWITLALNSSHPERLWAPTAMVFLGLSLLCLARTGRRPASPEPDPSLAAPPPEPPLSLPERLLLGIILIGLATAFARVILLPLDWDGWAIWQFKAKALSTGTLRPLLTAPEFRYSHPDYPLLVPAHTWWLSGGDFHEKAAQAGGFLFFLDLLALFFYEARERAGRTLALLGCAVLVSLAPMVKHASSGYADVPMAAFAFATMACLARGDLWTACPLLAGALLTKNEGLFTFGAALLTAGFLAAGPKRPDGTTPAARFSGPVLVTVTGLTALGAWSVIKRRWGLYSDMLDPHQWSPHLLSLLPGRMGVIAGGFLREALSVGPRYPGWGALWLLAPVGMVLSFRRKLAETVPFWLLVGVQFAGAAAAYLVTATDAGLHLSRSLDRLCLHVAPAALLATLIAFRPEPERNESGAPSRPPGDAAGSIAGDSPQGRPEA